MQCSRTDLHLERCPSPRSEDADRFRELLFRRSQGEPIAYLLGTQEFYGREFVVDERVLIPRPETEHLVEVVMRDSPGRCVIDVGTGSGAIAVTLAAERPEFQLLALDRSSDALQVARTNAQHCGVADRVRFAVSDLLATVTSSGNWSCVVANLPYVEPKDLWGLPRDVRDHEPMLALTPDRDRPEVLRQRLMDQARECLESGGLLALEVGAGQAGAVRDEMLRRGYGRIRIHNDLAGIGRVVAGFLRG